MRRTTDSVDPMDLFRDWLDTARDRAGLAHPAAACLSTVDESGSPAARFVDLKAVRADGFVFCTSNRSPKARHIEQNAHVALTFWWDAVGRQVRITGNAERIPDADADAFFGERSRGAQLTTWAFEQSATMDPMNDEGLRVTELEATFRDGPVPRPAYWGGYCVVPSRIEFLEFDESRRHRRLLYTRSDDSWDISYLQP